MIISVHLPKTAGESFYLALQSLYGEKILRDYGDGPMQKTKLERNKEALQSAISIVDKDFSGVECIHGHFMPVKYLLLGSRVDLKFITWLRNPIERAISHYYYWKDNYDELSAGQLQRKMLNENWDLERFVLCEELQNFYMQYLWGFPIDCFDYIGITERFNSDIAYLSEQVLHHKLDSHKVNVGKKPDYEISSGLRKEFEHFHGEDMELYQRILRTKSAWNRIFIK